MTATKSEKVPRALQAKFGEIVAITDAFAVMHLNDEYRQLIRYAVAALCRKRPSPLEKGRANTWACGITHAIGIVNFLFDPSQTPHMKAADLYRAFGIGQSTGQGKSKLVRDLLKMGQLDPAWTLPSRIADNPIAWMVMVDGMVVDIRRMPRELREAAFAKGLIPYVPEEGQDS
ncbi:MAG: DUF6398 domain-containing protein [Acidimicrobiia bacterium]|nr:DUF6398 domain-containing protein [Acidimicrobiia bacterium]